MVNNGGGAPTIDRNESLEERSPAAREVAEVEVGGRMVYRLSTAKPDSTKLSSSSLDSDDDEVEDDRDMGGTRRRRGLESLVELTRESSPVEQVHKGWRLVCEAGEAVREEDRLWVVLRLELEDAVESMDPLR